MFGKKQKEADDVKRATLDEVVAGLTLDEKISLVSGKDFWHTVEIPDAPIPVPSVMMSDGPHGLRKQSDTADNLGINDSIVAVCFPSAVGLAASFDTALMTKAGETLGEECQAENISTILGPAINIKRSPLCGRNFEYMSEDPYLAGEMATAYIKGVQSKNTGTSLKHFAANSQEKRRLMVSSEIDERALREIYLAGFEAAVKQSNPWTVMCSYNQINGDQVSESKKINTDILRDEWGYNGIVVSDWGAVRDRVKGLKAGVDLEMPGSMGVGAKYIKAAIESGELSEEELNKACRRIVNLAFKWKQNRIDCTFDREEHHAKAKEIALKTMVLLKNDNNILPLDNTKKIGFIGEYAKNPRYQGGGSSHINSYKVTDAFSCSRKLCNFEYAPGFGVDDVEPDNELINEAVKVAKDCDTVVIFAGLPESYESESIDRHHMHLPKCQDILINKVAEVQKNIVVVLHNGSPVEMPWIDKVNGVLESYLGGEAVGEAQTDILFGKVNPSAKIAETFPLKLSDTPCYNNFPGTFNTVEFRESIFVGYRYYETAKKEVLFPFGHGLSYTTFKYSALKLDHTDITPDKSNVTVFVTVTNTGKIAGEEIVEVFVSPEEKHIYRSNIEFKGFKKVALEPGESKTVEITLDKRAYAYYNTDEKDFVCDDGTYTIKVGASVADIRLMNKVTLSGFGIHKSPVSEEVQKMYENADVAQLSRSDFSKLLGREIIVSKPGKPYTTANCLGDARGTKFGDIIESLVSFVSKNLKMNIGSEEMIYDGAMEMPIRSFVSMSQGIVPEEMGEAIVDLMNEKRGALLKIAACGVKCGFNALNAGK